MYFSLEDNRFTMLCWFLPYINMNQPWVAEPFLICLMGAFIEFCEDYMRYYITDTIQVFVNYITIAPTLGPHSSFIVLHLDLFKCFSQAVKFAQDLVLHQWVHMLPACPSRLVAAPWEAMLRRMFKASRQAHHSLSAMSKVAAGWRSGHTDPDRQTDGHTHTPPVYTRQWKRFGPFFFPLFNHSLTINWFYLIFSEV